MLLSVVLCTLFSAGHGQGRDPVTGLTGGDQDLEIVTGGDALADIKGRAQGAWHSAGLRTVFLHDTICFAPTTCIAV